MLEELKFGTQVKNTKKDDLLIYDVKEDPIVEDSSQEPSPSNKYNFKDKGFFTNF